MCSACCRPSETRLRAGEREAACRILEALQDVGLGYLRLGQPSPSLSGGEAQRVKLARYLGTRSLAGQLLLLDEPSTGLHPQDLTGLLAVLDRLTRAGATIVVVEHNTDIIRAADWVVDLGPGAGPDGGRLLYAGPPEGLADVLESLTGRALAAEDALSPSPLVSPPSQRLTDHIVVQGARANNLQCVDVAFPKGKLTVVTGLSGSGKSSLVHDVLEAEARRHFLESLSMYERQTTREGPESEVDSVSGLGITVTIGTERLVYNRRATVGTATEVSHHLAVLLAELGERDCPHCGQRLVRERPVRRKRPRAREWRCQSCGVRAPLAHPRHFSPNNYGAACLVCHGVGTLQMPRPEKLIVHPEKPLCNGAMYSPGFFPREYLCEPLNHGYYQVQALAARYGFDPATTPWNEMTEQARHAFLFGDPEPLPVTSYGRKGRVSTHMLPFAGVYGWIRDWDVGGTYTATEPCAECHGAGLRPEYLSVRLGGFNAHELSEMPLSRLSSVLDELAGAFSYIQCTFLSPQESGVQDVQAPVRPDTVERGSLSAVVAASLRKARLRVGFLRRVGLGYLHLNRPAGTLSAGEAQRIRLAALLGSGLTSLTALLDEPTRGLHPSEVEALAETLEDLRDAGNTVIVVEHDPRMIRAADHIIDIGPGAGAAGGHIVATGTPGQIAQADTLTGRWLRGDRRPEVPRSRRSPRDWLTIRGARANNLKCGAVRLPLGVLVGICGVSGSGKSSLIVDTLGRALAPVKQTTSVAREPLDPGAHDSIEGCVPRTVIMDQSRAGIYSPVSYLALADPLRALYAAGEDARALGISEEQLGARCSACNGRGVITLDMEFLPDVHVLCETCRGTGFLAEAWQVRLRGLALPELYTLTIDEVYERFSDCEVLARPLNMAREVGLGYLVLRQAGHALSGGESQRLKIARELYRKPPGGTLYILDEPSVGQHLEDVQRLNRVLERLVHTVYFPVATGGAGVMHESTVCIIEHHPHMLAACDWLIELGPGGGPDGGRVVAEGTPEQVAAGLSPTAPYLRQALEEAR